jgi:CRISPR system Cascade subunit CasE
MYLTRFPINTARPETRRLLGSPHRLHGAVNMAFPEPPARDGTGPRVLWRLDQAPADRVDLLISSPERPDLTHLVEQAGWPSLEQKGWTTFAYGEFLEALGQGDVWAFRLTANPVHHIRRGKDPVDAPTKRAAHVTVRHQVRWLLKQQERAGFSVLQKPAPPTTTPPLKVKGDGHASAPADDPTEGVKAPAVCEPPEEWSYQLLVHDRTPLRFSRPSEEQPKPKSGADVRFTQATYDGCLQITDLTAFRRMLVQGLGKAKAYGCGLMTLAPVGGASGS